MDGDRTARDRELAMYRKMVLIREFEKLVIELVNRNEIPGVTHEYIGQEATAVGVCFALRADDVITSTHRGHGHVLAKGGQPRYMLAELMGRATGYNRGHGGSMHIADFSLGIYGANGIVGASAPMACGAALAFAHRQLDSVAVCFFGDGAINQGVLLESLNLAVIWNLPVVFVCENNKYAATTLTESVTGGTIQQRALGFGLRTTTVDGMSVREVHRAMQAAVSFARNGGGPSFLECVTYRYSGHQTAERLMNLSYRTDDEVDLWRARDPIDRLARQLDTDLTDQMRTQVADGVRAELDDALAFARESSWPSPASAFEPIYHVSYPDTPLKGWHA